MTASHSDGTGTPEAEGSVKKDSAPRRFLKKGSAKKGPVKKGSARQKLRPLNEEQLSHTFEQLSMLLGAGITPAEGLDIMLRDRDNTDLAGAYRALYGLVMGGVSLSEAVRQSGLFPFYAVQLLKIGEMTGRLDAVCSSLSSFYEAEDELHGSVRDAFCYPMIMAVMMFVLVIVLLSRVLPIFEQVFRQLGTSVSGVAAVLMNISSALSRYYAVFITLFLLLAVLFFYFNSTRSGQKHFRRFLQKCPFTRNLSEEIALSRFAAGMELTQSSGMDPCESLTMCRDIVENDAVAARIDACVRSLQAGSPFSDALADAAIFSSFYSSMIHVASMTGHIDTVMGYISRHYRAETDRRMDAALSRIEPAMVALLAILVGGILLSVILPLMGIMSSIG